MVLAAYVSIKSGFLSFQVLRTCSLIGVRLTKILQFR